jgi:hypothetical protein
LQHKVEDLVDQIEVLNKKVKRSLSDANTNAEDQKEILTKRIEDQEKIQTDLEQKLLKASQEKINLQAENKEKDD